MQVQQGNDPRDRFLGLTKLQFLGAIMFIVLLTLLTSAGSLAYAVTQNKARINSINSNQMRIAFLYEQAAEDHIGLCGFIADLDRRIDANRKLLSDQPSADPIIVAGIHIDRSAIEKAVQDQGAVLNSMRPVDCTNVDVPILED